MLYLNINFYLSNLEFNLCSSKMLSLLLTAVGFYTDNYVV